MTFKKYFLILFSESADVAFQKAKPIHIITINPTIMIPKELPVQMFTHICMAVSDVTIWRPIEWMLQKKEVVFIIGLN